MNQQASMQCIGDGALYNMFCYRHFCLLYSFFSRRSVIYRKNRFSLIKALLFLLQTFRLPAVRFAERYILFHRLFCEYLFWYDWTNRKNLFSSAAKYRFLFYFYVRLFCVSVCCDHIENIMRIFSDLTKFLFRFSFSVSLSLGTRLSCFILVLNLVFKFVPGVSMIVFSGLVLYYVFKRDHLFVLSSCLLSAFLKCMNGRPAHLARLLSRYLLRVIGSF